MKLTSFFTFTVGLVVGTLLLDACATSLPTGTAAVASAAALRDHTGSWMKAVPANAQLLYISDVGTNEVQVYSYPSGAHEGTLTGFDGPTGECTDSAGNIYITNEHASDVVVYAHGATTPFKTLIDPGELPASCAVDNSTGRVAILNFVTTSGGIGSISTYDGGSTSPSHNYSAPAFPYPRAIAYAGHKLYMEVILNSSQDPVMATMASNGTFSPFTLHGASLGWPGDLKEAIDDKYLAVGDSSNDRIYHVKANGQVIATTVLDTSCFVYFFTITKGRLVAPIEGCHNALIFPYPGGGSPNKTIGNLSEPVGSAVSP